MIKIYTEEEYCKSGSNLWGKGIIVIREKNSEYDKGYQCIGSIKNNRKFIQDSDGSIEN